MRSAINKVLVLFNFFFLLGYFNFQYLAETNKDSIINLFCMEYFKDEVLNSNLNYDEEIAKNACDCYLEEFLNSKSHQKSINKCKLETKQKFNL